MTRKGIAVTDLDKPRGSELPVSPAINYIYPSLTWNDSNFGDSGMSYNREKGPSLSLRKSDNYYGGYSWCSIVITGIILIIIVVISVTTQAAARITRRWRGLGYYASSHTPRVISAALW